MATALLAALALHLVLALATDLLRSRALALPGGQRISVRVVGQGAGADARGPAQALPNAAPGGSSGRASPVHQAASSPVPSPVRAERIPQGATSAGAREAEYLDARWLTQRPTPIGEVVIPTPESSASSGSFRATLVLSISDDGTVMKIDVSDSTLPLELEACARKAFATARFLPGRIGTHAVRSKLRVEVGFDTETATR